MKTNSWEEIFRGYQKHESRLCWYSFGFGVFAVLCDLVGLTASSITSATGMILCIFLAQRCHWACVDFLNREVKLV